ncbi:hypothetical protein [Acidianus brierleyi]|uniref:Uncharacterized protein n=1 Tax=Acidianus brierleyi TaxID=41673 RepID=A0A2U9IDN2_9CREN|nr:hypothetical protein [Acidianus brierleyi]AWR94137.1 hypothetical protein DFR85_05555 [Acidianus brierleyi]
MEVEKIIDEIMEKARSSFISEAETKYLISMIIWGLNKYSKDSLFENIKNTLKEAFKSNDLEIIMIFDDLEKLPPSDKIIKGYITAGDIIIQTLKNKWFERIRDESLRRAIENCKETIEIKEISNVNSFFRNFIPLSCEEFDKITGKKDSYKIAVRLLLGVYDSSPLKCKINIFNFAPDIIKSSLRYCHESL